MTEPVLHYNKLRTHKSSKSPRDIQTRQMQRTGSSSDESVLALKAELLDLKSEMLNLKSTPSTMNLSRYQMSSWPLQR